MALTKLGLYIKQSDARNDSGLFGEEAVAGLSTQKEIIRTKADLSGVGLTSYKLFPPRSFAYVPDTSRRGEKIALAFNMTQTVYLVSSIYVVFNVSDAKKLDPWYLFIYFNRPEFDRYARFNSWGSARETFNWEDMCDIDIALPDLSIQRKYVDIYKAMVANQRSYERGLEDLKLVCDGYIEDLRRKLPCEPVGQFIAQSKEKNTDGAITLEQGINIEKKFITPQRSNDNFYGRQIVRTGQIAYCTQLNNENVAVALRTGPDCIVSSVYDVIYVKDETELLPEYLMLWLSRREFGRYVYWASQGTSYEFLSYENLARYKIPVPELSVQKTIVGIYQAYHTRKAICEKLKAQIKAVCPVLIKGALEEGLSADGGNRNGGV